MAYFLEGRALPDGAGGETDTPCIFCGRLVRHINGGGTACYLGTVVGGKTLHYAYCNDSPCPQITADVKYEKSIWSCECVGGGYVEMVGNKCTECGCSRENAVREDKIGTTKWRVDMTGLAHMRGSIVVDAFSETDADYQARARSGDVSWSYEGIEDATIETDVRQEKA